MTIGLFESLAPTLGTVGLLVALLPWVGRDNTIARSALIGFTLLLTWRYLFWRATDTVPPFGLSADWLCGIIFVAAEILTGIGTTITWIILSRSSSRSQVATANTPWLLQERPLVDVLICTYDEDQPILERTIIGATAIDYPNFRVWVLDDGRREWLRQMCHQKGCYYLQRSDNLHAKAGNINNALQHLANLAEPPEFIAVLDADFVPFNNFLSRTVCLFKDATIGIV
jgi:cellulose synthase (UDP-forming)